MSEKVRQMFANISQRYDLANDVLSLGSHRLWRRWAIQWVSITPDSQIIDICCGTGDFALALATKLNRDGKVLGLDFAEPMITLAKKKNQSPQTVSFQVADAMHLPVEADRFDLATVAFGIRNVDDTPTVLKEMQRVLRPGGQALILEFGAPDNTLINQLYRLYARYFMPHIGAMLTGNRTAYQYLPETSLQYPCRDDFLKLMQNAEFTNCQYRSFFGGMCYAYKGAKLT